MWLSLGSRQCQGGIWHLPCFSLFQSTACWFLDALSALKSLCLSIFFLYAELTNKLLIPVIRSWWEVYHIDPVSEVIEHESGEVADMDNTIGWCSCDQIGISGQWRIFTMVWTGAWFGGILEFGSWGNRTCHTLVWSGAWLGSVFRIGEWLNGVCHVLVCTGVWFSVIFEFNKLYYRWGR